MRNVSWYTFQPIPDSDRSDFQYIHDLTFPDAFFRPMVSRPVPATDGFRFLHKKDAMFLSLSPDSRTGFFWYGSGGGLHSQFDSNLVRESEIALDGSANNSRYQIIRITSGIGPFLEGYPLLSQLALYFFACHS